MPRETPNARDVRVELAEMFPGKRMLNKSEVVRFTGLNYRTVSKLFDFDKGYISVVKLANRMG